VSIQAPKKNLPWSEGIKVIRQAVSCDICATEKRQTNHWFVAYEQSGELRVSGWNSRHRQRPDSKHLCGQTCLHKLVDEFMAKSIAVRPQHAVNEVEVESPAVADASLTSSAAYGEPESTARLLTPPAPVPPKPDFRPHPELVTMPPWQQPQNPLPFQGDKPRSVFRNWHAEAWERERERELRAIENRPDIASRRRSSA
jgi:hypothetical protein